MLKSIVSIDETIEFLNSLLEIDPEAVSGLFMYDVPCNEDLVKHPTVQVGQKFCTAYGVGVIGILNGLFGTIEKEDDPQYAGYGPISMMIDLEEHKITGFIRTDRPS